jgi:hypothetical protein
MLHSVALVRIDVSEESIASIIMVIRIGDSKLVLLIKQVKWNVKQIPYIFVW